MRARPHVIPVGGDEPHHFASPNCWCFPLVSPIEDAAAEFVPELVIHNAHDCREARERITGEGTGKPWVRVLEEVP